MAEEVRGILRAAVEAETPNEVGLGTCIVALFAGIGLRDDEKIPELRGHVPKSAMFD